MLFWHCSISDSGADLSPYPISWSIAMCCTFKDFLEVLVSTKCTNYCLGLAGGSTSHQCLNSYTSCWSISKHRIQSPDHDL